MKKTITKTFAICMACIMLVSTFCFGINAEEMSSVHTSPSSTAGDWTTCETVQLTSTLDTVYGGDTGIWFFANQVGLQASFVRSTTRKCYMNCWSRDQFDGEYFHFVRAHHATFSLSSGYYRPSVRHTDFDINPNMIDDDSNLDLYMAFSVETVSGDTSASVPAGLLKYAFWAY